MYVRWAVSVAVSALPPFRATSTDTNVVGYLPTAVADTRAQYYIRATARGIQCISHKYRCARQALAKRM